MDDLAIRIGTITIEYGLDDDGDPGHILDIDGDINYITALGLLESAKHQILSDAYGEDDEEGDDCE